MADWQIGDLALLVRHLKPSVARRTGLRTGGVYTVTGVVFASDGRCGLRVDGGVPHPRSTLQAFSASAFVKVTPGANIEGFEEPRRVPVKEDA